MGSSMSTASLSSELRDLYTEESARIQQEFFATGDGRAAVEHRTRLVGTIPAEQLTTGVTEDLVRLSVGLESVPDIQADLEAGFRAAKA